jgi:coenzyme F420-reducing hydrogenase alpha subunit
MHQISDINLKNISKVEGRANLHVRIKGHKVEKVEFQIAEYKRFYTWAIKGKNINTLPQMVSRICGTCSIAHLLCAIEAIEKALEIKTGEQTKFLCKLLMYGLIIRDHALHLYFFALPDYLDKDSILEFDLPAGGHGESNQLEHQLLHDAFAIKKAGNLLCTWIGGRAVHAMYPKVGGFVKLPDPTQKQQVIDQLTSARKKVFRVLDIFAQDKFNFARQTNFAALCPDDFNFLEGPLKSTYGWKISEKNYGEHLERVVIPYSMSSGYSLDQKSYMVGALARINLNKKSIHANTKKDTLRHLAKFPSDNIYLNNLAQVIEIIHSIDHSLEILENLKIKQESTVLVQPKKSTGVGVIEAPRGLLFYKLNIDKDGIIKDGQIVVPTSQNQINIEQDIKKLVEDNINKERPEIERMMEMLIRAYDPCMSCASHFLKVKWDK